MEVISDILALDASMLAIGASKHDAIAYQNGKNDNPHTADMVSLLRGTIAQYEKP